MFLLRCLIPADDLSEQTQQPFHLFQQIHLGMEEKILKPYFLPVPHPQGLVQRNIRTFLRRAKENALFLGHRNTLSAGRTSQKGFTAYLRQVQAHTRRSAAGWTHCWTLRRAWSCLAGENASPRPDQGSGSS